MTQASTHQPNRIWFILIAISALGAGLLAYFYHPQLQHTAINASPVPLCNLNSGPCEVTINGRSAYFSVSPTPIRSLQPLTVKLVGEDLELEMATLNLEGKEMYMGINQTHMSQTTASHWQGSTEIALCTTGKMQWLARLGLTDKSGQYHSAVFEFEAH